MRSGCYLCEQVFGIFIVNSDNKQVLVRDIWEDHIIQDLGFIPTEEQYLNNIKIQEWMSGTEKGRKSNKKFMSFNNITKVD